MEQVVQSGLNVPVEFNYAQDVVDRLAGEDRAGLIFVDVHGHRRDYRFSEIADLSKRYALAFHELGVRRGDRVLVVLPAIAKWAFAMLGLFRIGAVPVLCDDRIDEADLIARANDCRATAIVAHRRNRRSIDAGRNLLRGIVRFCLIGEESYSWTRLDTLAERGGRCEGEPLDAGDEAYISFHGAHGIVHTVGSTFAQRLQARHWLDARPSDVVWCAAPAGSVEALWYSMLGPWSCGAAVVIHEGRFDSVERLELLSELNVTVLCQSAPAFGRLANDPTPIRLPHLRRALCAAGTVDAATAFTFAGRFGPQIRSAFAPPETGLIAGDLGESPLCEGAAGRALPGIDLRITGGKIAVRDTAPTLFRGYVNDEPGTRARFSGGWFLTGENGRIDDDGFVFLEP